MLKKWRLANSSVFLLTDLQSPFHQSFCEASMEHMWWEYLSPSPPAGKWTWLDSFWLLCSFPPNSATPSFSSELNMNEKSSHSAFFVGKLYYPIFVCLYVCTFSQNPSIFLRQLSDCVWIHLFGIILLALWNLSELKLKSLQAFFFFVLLLLIAHFLLTHYTCVNGDFIWLNHLPAFLFYDFGRQWACYFQLGFHCALFCVLWVTFTVFR